jgi:DNA-binding NarL/FixJ family response regulator
VSRSFSILLAEPNLVLREKIASVLARDERIWCVVQVDGAEGLARGAGRIRPDLILADISILKHQDMLIVLRKCSAGSRIIALADSQSEPYVKAARRLGLDGAVEKGRVEEGIGEEIRLLSTDGPGAGRDVPADDEGRESELC